LKDDKIKELSELLKATEKLIIRLISIVGWLKILIDILQD